MVKRSPVIKKMVDTIVNHSDIATNNSKLTISPEVLEKILNIAANVGSQNIEYWFAIDMHGKEIKYGDRVRSFEYEEIPVHGFSLIDGEICVESFLGTFVANQVELVG